MPEAAAGVDPVLCCLLTPPGAMASLRRVARTSPATGGAVAQLGERLNGIQEVDGSIPFSSTNPFGYLRAAPYTPLLSQVGQLFLNLSRWVEVLPLGGAIGVKTGSRAHAGAALESRA